jgi:hypothetical protein
MNVLVGNLKSPITQAALDYWHDVSGDRPMPARDDLSLGEMVDFLPNLILLDVLREPLDFRYRLIGTRIEEFMAEPYTGRCLSEIPHQAPPSAIWSNCEKAVEAAAPIIDDAPYVGPKKDIVTPEALLLPLSVDGSAVEMLMVAVDYFRRAADDARLPGS